MNAGRIEVMSSPPALSSRSRDSKSKRIALDLKVETKRVVRCGWSLRVSWRPCTRISTIVILINTSISSGCTIIAIYLASITAPPNQLQGQTLG